MSDNRGFTKKMTFAYLTFLVKRDTRVMHKTIFTSEAMSFFAGGSSLRNKIKLLPGHPSIKGHSGSSAWRQMLPLQESQPHLFHFSISPTPATTSIPAPVMASVIEDTPQVSGENNILTALAEPTTIPTSTMSAAGEKNHAFGSQVLGIFFFLKRALP